MSDLQIKAVGLEDYYLSNNPVSSFLYPKYEQHQKFATQIVEIRANENLNFSKTLGQSRAFTFDIYPFGHFLHRMFLHIKTPILTPRSGNYASWTNGFMTSLVDKAELVIGGDIVDTRTGIQMDIESELNLKESQTKGYNIMIGKMEIISGISTSDTEEHFVLPFNFWFNKNVFNSLPLALMKYQKVKIVIYLRSFLETITFDGNTPPDEVNLIDGYMSAEFLNIEKDYMKNFVMSSILDPGIEYLIEQCSILKTETIPEGKEEYKTTITFNHPVKELQWVIIEEDSINNSDWFNYSRRIDNGPPMINARFIMEGIDQNKDLLPEAHFRCVEPYKHHTRIPNKYINVYSFALKPEDINPSGSLNFSSLSLVQLYMKMNSGNKTSRLYLFGINYNVLTVLGGQAILKFIN